MFDMFFQNPNRSPSEHPTPTTKIGTKMGGEFLSQNSTIGFDPRPNGCGPKNKDVPKLVGQMSQMAPIPKTKTGTKIGHRGIPWQVDPTVSPCFT